jgi:proteasome alpha subunit
MPMPFYVPPEQLMKDRSDYARKGIARGKPVMVLEFADGILFIADNPSATLHKVAEIYDRIAFAAVGKFSEFENLRISGVRLADIRGYSYGREDVTARALANAYSQLLSNIFTQEMKPYEVEIIVAQVGEQPEENEIYHILFDGSVTDEDGFVAMGGEVEALSARLGEGYKPGMVLEEAVHTAVEALGTMNGGPLPAERVEAAVLDRRRGRRKFRRLSDEEIARLVGTSAPGPERSGPADAGS